MRKLAVSFDATNPRDLAQYYYWRDHIAPYSTRLETIAVISSLGQVTSRDLAQEVGISANAASQRLKELEDHGVVRVVETRSGSKGRLYVYELAPEWQGVIKQENGNHHDG